MAAPADLPDVLARSRPADREVSTSRRLEGQLHRVLEGKA
jgi:hypothetical protein